MTRRPTQAERVLEALRLAGPRGLHSFEMRRGMYIGNPSERIADLERLGHLVSATRERLAGEAFGTRYRLVRDVGDLVRGLGTDSPTVQCVVIPKGTTPLVTHEERLFEPAPVKPLGAYDSEAA